MRTTNKGNGVTGTINIKNGNMYMVDAEIKGLLQECQQTHSTKNYTTPNNLS